MSRVLKGFHVTVNARNEEEVDTDIIVDKLASGSTYSFKDRGQVVKESGPVVSDFSINWTNFTTNLKTFYLIDLKS